MELQHLKDIAAKLNMNVHHNIGIEKLKNSKVIVLLGRIAQFVIRILL